MAKNFQEQKESKAVKHSHSAQRLITLESSKLLGNALNARTMAGEPVKPSVDSVKPNDFTCDTTKPSGNRLGSTKPGIIKPEIIKPEVI